MAGALLDLGQQRVAGLRSGHAGDAFELGQLRVLGGLQLLLHLAGVRLAVGDRLLAAGDLLGLGCDHLVAGADPLLALGQLGPAIAQLAFLLRTLLQQLLAGGHARLLQLRLGTSLGVAQDACRLPFRLRDPARAHARTHGVADATADDQRGEADQRLLHHVSFGLSARVAAGVEDVTRSGAPSSPQRVRVAPMRRRRSARRGDGHYHESQ